MTIEDMSWADKAICKGKTSIFYAPPGHERLIERERREAIAMTYCRQCPVQMECREYGRHNGELGIWGGENEEMRWKAGYLKNLRNTTRKRYAKKFGLSTDQQTSVLQKSEQDSTARL